MCKPDKTYHCTVKKSNQTLVSEYDVSVSKVENNLLVNLFYWLVFVINVASILLFASLIVFLIYLSITNITPSLNIWICIFVYSIILVFLMSILIVYNKTRKNKNVKLLPECDASLKSFGFYAIMAPTILGSIVSCIITKNNLDNNPYQNAMIIFYCIITPFYFFSLLWVAYNVYKALKCDYTDKYIAKLNQVIQFCVSVLTIIGIYIGKIDDSNPNVRFILFYTIGMSFYLFVPFVISFVVDKYSC